MIINLFALASLSLSVACFLLAYLIFVYSKIRLHRLWALFNVSVAIFGLGTFFVGISKTYQHAFLSWKIAFVGISYIAMFFYLVVYEFCKLSHKKMLYFVCIHGVLFSIFAIATDVVANSLRYAFNQFYYYEAGIGFNSFFSIWILIVACSFINLYNYIRKSSGIKLIQGRYLFFGMLLGFLSGSTTAIPSWGIDIYPGWHFFICIYAAISTYAIFKYQLMDIRIAATRLSVFVAVYSLVLGVPFGLAVWGKPWLGEQFGEGWFWAPMLSLLVLATMGPFVYLYIQKHAEEMLLQEQRQYQTTLRQASMGMGQIKDLKRLLQLIVHIVTKAVSIEHCEILLLHEESKQLILKASRGGQTGGRKASVLALESSLVKHLKEIKEPVVYDEVKQYAQDYEDGTFKEIEADINRLDGALIVPSFIEQKLIAILILGNKKSGKLYTQDDLAVFSILANQAALAIENALFYEKMKETHLQLIKAEKMATVGTMADGLSHQINNRLHAMGFIAGDVLDTIKLKKKEELSPDMQELLDEIEHSLVRIEDNVKRGGEIVEGLLKYTRKGSEGFEAIDLNKLLDSSLEMVQFKIKLDKMDFIRSFKDDIPRIKGNFTQLQEVFFNIIDNSYDAMMQRKDEMKEEGFRPTLEVLARRMDQEIEILIRDNGIGVKKEDVEKLFTPFFTTKLSSKKGTGLGLYVMRQLIEENHGGKVEFTSKYKTGSQTRILLPIAT